MHLTGALIDLAIAIFAALPWVLVRYVNPEGKWPDDL